MQNRFARIIVINRNKDNTKIQQIQLKTVVNKYVFQEIMLMSLSLIFLLSAMCGITVLSPCFRDYGHKVLT